MSSSPVRYIAKCKACNVASSALLTGHPASPARGEVVPVGVVHYDYMTGGLCLVCRGCGKAKYAKAVRGVFSAKHVCSAKCMASTGTQCECSCAGKNHGASHG